MFDEALQQQAAGILQRCKQKGLVLATAESCTGGLLAALLTEIPGSSAAFAGGAVTYSNALKHTLLGVSLETLHHHGAVSKEVAGQMAKGVQKMAKADIAVSITGIAGPDGSSKEKPVGLVYIGIAAGDALDVEENIFSGNRNDIRRQTVHRALELLQGTLSRSFSASA